MPSTDNPLGVHLEEVKRILESCGASEIRLLQGGGEVQFLVRMNEGRTLLDIVPAEEELARLLEHPVFIIPEQTLHPDQADRLKEGAEIL